MSLIFRSIYKKYKLVYLLFKYEFVYENNVRQQNVFLLGGEQLFRWLPGKNVSLSTAFIGIKLLTLILDVIT